MKCIHRQTLKCSLCSINDLRVFLGIFFFHLSFQRLVTTLTTPWYSHRYTTSRLVSCICTKKPNCEFKSKKFLSLDLFEIRFKLYLCQKVFLPRTLSVLLLLSLIWIDTNKSFITIWSRTNIVT